jgi:MFS family permease
MTEELPSESSRQEEVGEAGRGNLLASVPRRVLLLVIVLAVNGFAFSYLMIFITGYLPEIGVPTETVGLIIGAEGLAVAILSIPLGILSDRRGRKNIMILGTVGTAPVFFLMTLVDQPLILVIAGLVGGIFEGAMLATINALIADQTTPANRDSAFTISFIVGAAGGTLGTALPFVVPGLSSVLGISVRALHVDLLYLFGVVSIFLPIELYVIFRDYQEKPRPPSGLLRGRSTRTLLKFSGINSLIGLGAGLIIPLIPTWLFLRFSIPDTYSGPILAIAGTTIGLGAVFSPRLAKRFGSVGAIVLTQGLSLVFMVALAFVGDPITASIVYVIRTMLMNMSSPLADSFLMGIVVPEERGFASSLNSVIWRVPNSVTTIIGGALLASGQYVLPFLLAGAFYAVSISLFFATFRKTKTLS